MHQNANKRTYDIRTKCTNLFYVACKDLFRPATISIQPCSYHKTYSILLRCYAIVFAVLMGTFKSYFKIQILIKND